MLAVRTGVDRHDVAVVLGSGWAPAARALGEPLAEMAMAEIPGFTAPGADGIAARCFRRYSAATAYWCSSVGFTPTRDTRWRDRNSSTWSTPTPAGLGRRPARSIHR